MTRDLRTLIYLLNLELREECSGPGMAWAGMCSRGAAVEADAIGGVAAGSGGKRGAAVEEDAAIGRAAAEATQAASSS